MADAPAKTGQKKSGMKTFAAGDVLFHEGDPADSLFIIQKGQIRLYLPKGRGFVDLAILRSGEVIGEMAYFDENTTRRSCSAAALTGTQVIEISFKAFSKTMEGLNPWFKTIINTLADRLRKTNDKVKALESNSLVYGKEGKVGEYEFFHKADVLKLLSLFYLTFKSHAEQKDGHYLLHMSRLKFYMLDIFGISEIKYEEFFLMLEKEGFIQLLPDEDKLLKMIQIRELEAIRSIMVFMNMQRMVDDNKKISLSTQSVTILKKILTQVKATRPEEDSVHIDLSTVLKECQAEGHDVNEDHLKDASQHGLCEDVMVVEGNRLSVEVYHVKLRKILPPVQLMNAIKKINESKNN